MPRQLEGDSHQAGNLLFGVHESIDRLAFAGPLPALAGLAEIDAARQLTHHDEIDAAQHLGLERRRFDQLGQDLHGAQVGVQAEALAQSEEGLLGTNRCLRHVPLWSPDGTQEDGIVRLRQVQGPVGQRRVESVDCGATDDRLAERQSEPEMSGAGLEHALRLLDHLGSNAVTRQNQDFHVTPPRAASRSLPAHPLACNRAGEPQGPSPSTLRRCPLRCRNLFSALT